MSHDSISKGALKQTEKEIPVIATRQLKVERKLNYEVDERKRAEQITRMLFRISNAVNTTKDLGELYSSIHLIFGGNSRPDKFFYCYIP